MAAPDLAMAATTARPAADQRHMGSLRAPVERSFLPAARAVAEAALMAAGSTAVPTPALVDTVVDLVDRLLTDGDVGRSWLLELERDDADVFVRVWLPLAVDASVELGGHLVTRLEQVTGSYDVHREGTELLVVLQVELAPEP